MIDSIIITRAMFDIKLPERACRKCGKKQIQLIDQLCDLLQQQTTQLDSSQYICQRCAKKAVEPKKHSESKRTFDIPKHFKAPVVIKFEKEQRERQALSKKKFIPQLIIQILMHFKFKNPTLYAKLFNNALTYQQRREKDQHFMQGEGNARQVYPKYVSTQNNGDGKLPSGYREDWEKGIAQILDAFNNNGLRLN